MRKDIMSALALGTSLLLPALALAQNQGQASPAAALTQPQTAPAAAPAQAQTQPSAMPPMTIAVPAQPAPLQAAAAPAPAPAPAPMPPAAASPARAKFDSMHPRQAELLGRIKDDRERVAAGLADKTLDAGQARRLTGALDKIQAAVKRDGKDDLTQKEFKALNGRLDRVGGKIHHDKKGV